MARTPAPAAKGKPFSAPRARRKRVVSGMRPTGRLHLGHYFGALSNWIRMQEEYDCFYFVADWHALTTDYADASQVAMSAIEIGIDWLAAGLDPEKSTLFLQSRVPEHSELHLLLSMVTPLGWLERVPSYKEQIEQLRDRDLHTYGFLGYPLLQAADIVIYDADFVPVGDDQVPHVELTREIVRRFNSAYAPVNWKKARASSLANLERQLGISATVEEAKALGVQNWVETALRKLMLDHRLSLLANAGVPMQPVLREPTVLLTETPRLPGTDGRKMSKSYQNFILLGEEPDSIRAKVRGMMTDPQRVRRQDPGRPEVCPVFAYHKLFSADDTIARVDRDCRTAAIGCVDCKGLMADALVRWIEPIHQRREAYQANRKKVREILEAGSEKARRVARRTMRRAREAIFGWSGTRKHEPSRKREAAAGD